MNRLRCGPISRASGPVTITVWKADGTTVQRVISTHEADAQRAVEKAISKLAKEEQEELLRRLQSC